MQDLIVEFHPPTDILQVIKAFLDLFTFIAFIGVLIVIIYASKRYPMFERKRTFWPLVIFAVLGIISTGMDAIDEWFWFTPQEFYNYIWKPARLIMFLVGIFILVISFWQFYSFSERLFGDNKHG
jgi:hypothetical protein